MAAGGDAGDFDTPATRRAFKLLVKLHGDPDKDVISVDAFKNAVQTVAMDDKVDVDFARLGDLMKAIEKADANSDGVVDGAEFNEMLRGGFVSADTLYAYYAPAGEKEVSDELEKLISDCFGKLDPDKKGGVDQTTLRNLFKPKVPQPVWINHFDIDKKELNLDDLIGGVRALLQAGDAEDRALCEHLEAKLKELDNQSVTGADGEEHKNPNGCCCNGCCYSGCHKDRIIALHRNEIRLAFRIGNLVAAGFVLLSAVLGFITEPVSYAAVVLQIILIILAVGIVLLEIRCTAGGFDTWLRRTLHHMYFVQGKAIILLFVAFGCFGCGPGGIALGLCVFIYAAVCLYIIAVHPKIGTYFSTTQADRAELLQRAVAIHDEAQQSGKATKEELAMYAEKIENLKNREETGEEQFAMEQALMAAESVPAPLFSAFTSKLDLIAAAKDELLSKAEDATSPQHSGPIPWEPTSNIGVPQHQEPNSAVESNPTYVPAGKAEPVSPASSKAPLAPGSDLEQQDSAQEHVSIDVAENSTAADAPAPPPKQMTQTTEM